MKDTIKFQPQFKPDFINELRDSIKEYFDTNRISKYGNIQILFKSLFMFALYFVPYILMLTGVIDSLLVMVFCWLTMGVGMAGVGMALMHDANHGTCTQNRTLNTWLSYSLYLLGGYPINWQCQHNTLHHGYTNIDGFDDDIAPIWLLRFSPHKPLLKVHKFQFLYAWFFYGLMTLSWTLLKDYQQLYSYSKKELFQNNKSSLTSQFIKLIVSKIAYFLIFLVLPILLLPISWYAVVLLYLMMHFTSGFLLSVIFQTAHVVPSSEFPLPDADGNIENNWAIHQLLTTADFAPKSKILSWMIGGLNYQIEHHLFPNISHVHYKNIAHLVKATAEKYGLPYNVQPTLLYAVSNHAKMLKMLGKK